ncbi:MAG: amidohydrolase family protein [Bacteroidota bacterium]
MKKNIGLLLLLWSSVAQAQVTFPVNDINTQHKTVFAFTNATIWVDYQTKVENATLVITGNTITRVGKGSAPKEAFTIDLQGKSIYPSFIDLYSSYGLPEVKAMPRFRWGEKPPQIESNKKGAYNWNQTIQPEVNAVELFQVNDKKAKALREIGFGTVLTHHPDGLVRGSGALVTLRKDRENVVVLKGMASSHLSMIKGSSQQSYPSSVMGRVALIRQTYLDADWYKNYKGVDKETNISLEAFNDLEGLPTIFEVNSRLNTLRANKIGDEFGKQYIFKGGGDEYQRLKAIKQTNSAFIIPLNFPEAYDVQDPYDAYLAELSELKHWELAPSNAAMLQKEGVTFTFTADGLKDMKKFHPHLQKAIKRGLEEQAALKALTYTPASLLGMESVVGSLKSGMLANFIITSGDIFDKETVIYENWIQGERHELRDWAVSDLRGVYQLPIDGRTLQLAVEGTTEKPTYTITQPNDSTKIKVNAQRNNNLVTLSFNLDKAQPQQMVRLSGWYDGKNMKGEGQKPDGNWFKWTATFQRKPTSEEKQEERKEAAETLGKVIYPFVAYGWETPPKQEDILFKNATVWTNEQEGILEETDVLVKGGKITQVGKNLNAGGAKVVEATGKHLTSGIIDEHSHIALSSVNEGTQASSAEVRMYDAINSEDVNIYRQLSGGVTAAQLLHGSANPIGGQSALVKFRWGSTPEALKIEGAEGFIKFALGENVKQSNWGDFYTVRFPQTRMGVEQVMVDAFTRAKEYEAARRTKGNAVRKDLELEALLEIVNKKRFITCHSYVQSEINMLMKVAEQFGFKVNIFTHILEGYKLADKMAKHGAGGSTFSDWWAYKMEVKDAIPYNAVLMHEQGVVVAINSDDAEMARRLNQEAAKAVKYGGMSEEDAWKMVTLNPAKLLHLEDRMGSIKTGKDADLVLWSAHPLSIYAQAEKTMVDGIVYYDLKKDEQKRDYIQKERVRIIQKMMEAKAGGAAAQRPPKKKRHLFHCDDMESLE